MPRTYLHIGTPKTATTTFQCWLARNTGGLGQIGTFAFENPIFGHRLAIEAITNAGRKKREDVKRIMQCSLSDAVFYLKTVSKDPNIKRLIISSEYFCDADPTLARCILSDISLTDVKIVVLFRRQDRYIESSYNEEVRTSRRKNRLRDPEYWPHFDWWCIASAWAKAFSRENVIPLIYDDLIDRDTPIVELILQVLDPELGKFAAGTVEERANPSWPAELLECQRLANRVGVNMAGFVEEAWRQGVGGPAFRLHPAVAKKWIDIYRESNRKLSEEFMLKRRDLFDDSDLFLESARFGADYTGQLTLEFVATLLALYIKTRFDPSVICNRVIEKGRHLVQGLKGGST